MANALTEALVSSFTSSLDPMNGLGLSLGKATVEEKKALTQETKSRVAKAVITDLMEIENKDGVSAETLELARTMYTRIGNAVSLIGN